MTTAFNINNLINLPQAEEFGTGKVVALGENSIQVAFPFHPHATPGRPYVSWFSLEKAKVEMAAEQNDPRFEAVTGDKPARKSAVKRAPKAPAVSHSFEDALNYFLKIYPSGFKDPAYVAEGKKAERAARLAAQTAYQEALGSGVGQGLLKEGNLDELRNRLDSVLEKAGFLHVLERLAFKKALKESPQAKAYFEALFSLLDQSAPESESFEKLAQATLVLTAAKEPTVAKWPVVTLPLFLARPEAHMFLKPTATKQAAGRIGFNLNYDARVNWKTYESLLEMGRALLEKLKANGASDFTDVQCFIAATEDKNISPGK
jgi:hypothetical protein